MKKSSRGEARVEGRRRRRATETQEQREALHQRSKLQTFDKRLIVTMELGSLLYIACTRKFKAPACKGSAIAVDEQLSSVICISPR